MEPPEFGRIAAQAAKQVIVQRVRQAEREQVVDAFKDRVGELVHGKIERMERGGIVLDLGENAKAFIPSRHTIPGETARINDRIRGYLYEVRPDQRGPQLFVSRTMKEFLIELFKLEVPEIGQEPDRNQGCGPRSRASGQDCRACARQADRSDRCLRRHARLARAGRLERAGRRAYRHHPVG
jgi:hypothetical protein